MRCFVVRITLLQHAPLSAGIENPKYGFKKLVGPSGPSSLLFKKLHVVRFFDRKHNVLVYVAYSDRVIEGSPKNSISTVPIMGWPAP